MDFQKGMQMNDTNKNNDDSWKHWINHIREEIIRFNNLIKDIQTDSSNYKLEVQKLVTNTVIDLNEKLNELDKKIIVLQVKSGLWGALSGLVSAGIILFITWMKSKG